MVVYESSRYQWVVISALQLITKEKWIKHYTVYNFSRVTHFWGYFWGRCWGHFWGTTLQAATLGKLCKTIQGTIWGKIN